MSSRRSIGGRRSSIHGSATGTSDPREWSDKQYLKKAIRDLVVFLSETGYPDMISAKMLAAPSNKIFVKMFQHIYGLLDPMFPWDKYKPEDEIPEIMKYLGYPFPIKKSTIFASGSSHNWPKLLGALTWLVDATRFLDMEDEIITLTRISENIFDPQDSDLFFSADIFDHGIQSYADFMSGHIDKPSCELLFAGRMEELVNTHAHLEEKHQGCIEELQKLEAECPALSAIETKRSALQEDRTRFLELIKTLKQHQERYQLKTAQTMQAITEKEQELEALNAEIAKLKVMRDQQEMTTADVERINAKQRQLERDLDLAEQRKDQLEQDLCKVEIDISKTVDGLQEQTAEANVLLQQFGMEAVVSVNGSVDQPHEQLNRQFPTCWIDDVHALFTFGARQQPGEISHPVALNSPSSCLLPVLQGQLHKLTSQTKDSDLHKLELKDRCQQLEEAVVTKRDDLSVMQTQLEALEQQCGELQEVISREYKKQQSHVTIMQSENQKRRMQLAGDLQDMLARKADLEAKQQQLQVAQAQERKAFANSVRRLIQMFTPFANEIHEQLETLEGGVDGVVAESKAILRTLQAFVEEQKA
ncbi:uncharacterized protein MONBRDRAFT_22944 [Monosiga brevicollis MX1]|uniref:Kinetochore protein NDC80 n=1 Tax=Monosiga brevicollis TaxID=81824 RepID=A9USJ1_MONBE|nr:uncharacterized protein MONBRDRAFT_22944 [Monosiga brevicollis MX1]EDQ92109.1 predicted protein [Monosiga brevicollis MX1]|eukprot:XP_001743395.1 hypothetical protein [Monosiga brevicollis MX1]